MESRLERYRQPKRPKWVRLLTNIGLLTVLFVIVLALSNWMAPNVLRWLSITPNQPIAQQVTLPSASAPAETAAIVMQTEPSSTPVPVATQTPEPTAEVHNQDQVLMRFVGDILLGSKVGDLIRAQGIDYPYRAVQSSLQSADFTMGNLEAPITDGGVAEEKMYVFKVDKNHVPGLKDAGFDLLSLANNHTYDYGVKGLQDTLAALKDHDIPYVGAGSNDAEAYAPYIFEKNGLKVAVFGFSRVLPTIGWAATAKKPGLAQIYDSRMAIESIRRHRGLVDLIVVYNHWGVERSLEPKPYQPELGRSLIDAGADLIIGSHPHVVQGFENYNGKWIVYSLGNFIFTSSGSQYTSDSVILDAICSKNAECQLKLTPLKISEGQPKLVDVGQASAILNRLDQFSNKLGSKVNTDGTVEVINSQNAVTP